MCIPSAFNEHVDIYTSINLLLNFNILPFSVYVTVSFSISNSLFHSQTHIHCPILTYSLSLSLSPHRNMFTYLNCLISFMFSKINRYPIKQGIITEALILYLMSVFNSRSFACCSRVSTELLI